MFDEPLQINEARYFETLFLTNLTEETTQTIRVEVLNGSDVLVNDNYDIITAISDISLNAQMNLQAYLIKLKNISKETEMKAVTKSKLKLAGTVGFFFVWFIVTLCSVLGFFSGFDINRKISLNRCVEAVLVEAFPASLGTSGSYWDLMYEFIDEDGTEYSGRAGMHFTKKTDAASHIGEIILIYIDENGLSTIETKKWTTSKLIVFGTIAVISILSAPAYIIVFLVPHKKRVKSKIDY